MKKLSIYISVALAAAMLVLSLSACRNDGFVLMIDNNAETVTQVNQIITGNFESHAEVLTVTYTIATEIDDYEITDSGIANVEGNKFSADVLLKPQKNKITVSATNKDGETTSESVTISYDSGTIYELDESQISYDSATGTNYVNNIIIIYFEEDVSESRKREIVSSINGSVAGTLNTINQWQVEIPQTDLDELKNICARLETMEDVFSADYDIAVQAAADISTNDPYKNANGGDWYLEAIDAYSAWDYNERFSEINIGIIDNGFDTEHEDLKGVIRFPQNWIESTNSEEWHGTFVAGIIGATANNEKGMAGLVWNSNLYCVDWQPTGDQKWDTNTRILSGLVYAVEAGAKVVNYSLGCSSSLPNGSTDWESIRPGLVDAWGELSSKYIFLLLNKKTTENQKRYDFIVVQSSGNGTSGKDNPDDENEKCDPSKILAVDAAQNGFFCSVTEENCFITADTTITKQDILDRIIIVGNAQKNEDGNYQQAVDSNGGEQVDICAPGTNIYSAISNSGAANSEDGVLMAAWRAWKHGNYSVKSGTSAAAPMVTSVCSMVWSLNSKFTGAEVKDIVCNSYDENIWVWDNPDGKHTTADDYRMVSAKLSVEEAILRTDTNSEGEFVAESETAEPHTMISFIGMTVGELGDLYGTDYEVSDGGLVPDAGSPQKAVYYADGRLPFSFLTEVEAGERTEDAVFTAVVHHTPQEGRTVDGAIQTDISFSELTNQTSGELLEGTTFGPDGYEYAYEAANGVFAVFRYYDAYPGDDTVADMVEVTSDPYGLYVQTAQNESVLYANDTLTVTGRLRTAHYTVNTANTGTAILLELDTPLTARLYDASLGYNGEAHTVDSVQVSLTESEYETYKNQSVTVTGMVVFGHTAHHLREIVLTECQIV